MATECGGVGAFENEVLIVEYDIQMRSLPRHILLGVERNPCHFIRIIYTELLYSAVGKIKNKNKKVLSDPQYAIPEKITCSAK